MKKILLLFLLLGLFSCNDKNKKKPDPKNQLEPVFTVEELTKDSNTWWSYHYYKISLNSEFKPLDQNSETISKDEFLEKLTSGNYIPIEMKTDTSEIYKLYKIPPEADRSISSTIKSVSAGIYNFYKMEGSDFPEFEATDLEGKVLNNRSLNGKVTVIKTWFIACKPCVAEMPELNKLVERTQNEDIQFISLALDEAPELQEFLEKQVFKYAVIPDQDELIGDKLKLNAYPTHLLVNKTGKIEKVFSKSSELIAYLEKYNRIKFQSSDSKLPPPPPPPPAPTNENT